MSKKRGLLSDNDCGMGLQSTSGSHWAPRGAGVKEAGTLEPHVQGKVFNPQPQERNRLPFCCHAVEWSRFPQSDLTPSLLFNITNGYPLVFSRCYKRKGKCTLYFKCISLFILTHTTQTYICLHLATYHCNRSKEIVYTLTHILTRTHAYTHT